MTSVLGYIYATPIGGAKVVLLDRDGNALTGQGKVYYTIWTFDEKGSIKVLERGSLERRLLFSENTIRISSNTLNEARVIAGKTGSKTAFIGVDVWVVKNGAVYTLPPDSFEVTPRQNTLPKTVKLNFDLREAKRTPLAEIERKAGVQPEGYINPPWFEWRTVREQRFQNVKIPVLIIHNNAQSDIFGTADIGITVQKYWGPDVTVAMGDRISEKVEFDPSSITVKVLGRSITNYFAGGDDITVPKGYSWGYVWIKGTVHYIYQKEYMCERDSHGQVLCSPTGNERYFAKIDSFTIDRVSGNVEHIESGSTLGEPPYSFPNSWMEKSRGISVGINDPVSLSEFYGKIYAGSDGHSFGVGIPIGAILDALARGSLPPWFATITVGFSVSDYSSYVMLGHVKNNGPSSDVIFYAMESNYTVEIPVHHWYGTGYERVNVPVGLYVEADRR
ncbi:hypothetical protein [Thermococcus henrietii]|uniref:hypothetical protein n=1 Tax=Thermococcus henrietii TaxID=2016361 RepID=UPI000C07F8BE|nr:hypothetical protein [Thermococcus henrietii]